MNLVSRILDVLYPPRCAACDSLLRRGEGCFCAPCAVSLTPLHATSADRREQGLQILAPDAYGAALADAIVRLKHGDRPEIARVLGARILARWPAPPVAAAALVPVPLHPRDLRDRGYNQAGLLAANLARAWGLPLVDALRRTRRSGSQRGRDPAGRKAAVAHAFALSRGGAARIGDRSVVLVDDVVTTGATAREVARILRAAGLKVGAVVAAARAL